MSINKFWNWFDMWLNEDQCWSLPIKFDQFFSVEKNLSSLISNDWQWSLLIYSWINSITLVLNTLYLLTLGLIHNEKWEICNMWVVNRKHTLFSNMYLLQSYQLSADRSTPSLFLFILEWEKKILLLNCLKYPKKWKNYCSLDLVLDPCLVQKRSKPPRNQKNAKETTSLKTSFKAFKKQSGCVTKLWFSLVSLNTIIRSQSHAMPTVQAAECATHHCAK